MKLHALQYLRAIAALVVVYSHACLQVPAYTEQLIEFGSFGVDIFFVISGFIMMYIAKPTDTPVKFMVNRFRRVAPMYWFFTLLMAVIFLMMPAVFKNAELQFAPLLKSLLFIPHYSDAHPGKIWPVVPPGWSLNYEMYFYALFALSLLLASKFRLLFVTLAISSVFIAAKMLTNDNAFVGFFSNDVVFEFIFGMVLAQAWRSGFRLSSRTGWILIVVGFTLLLLHSQKLGLAALPLYGVVLNGIPSLMIVVGCLFITVPYSKLLVLLGDASYALYLAHIFVLGLLRKILPPILGYDFTGAMLFIFISLAICLVVSIPVHQWVDNWLLREERLGRGKKMATNEAR